MKTLKPANELTLSAIKADVSFLTNGYISSSDTFYKELSGNYGLRTFSSSHKGKLNFSHKDSWYALLTHLIQLQGSASMDYYITENALNCFS
jgi:hypothetical protein